jgi:hypothetical protein
MDTVEKYTYSGFITLDIIVTTLLSDTIVASVTTVIPLSN